jgi:transcriptional regulator with XRE-family HTH domain
MTRTSATVDTTGNRIRARRKELGLTPDAVAKQLGISRAAVSQWETGKITSIAADNLLKLALVLQIDPYVLVGLNGASTGIPGIEADRLADAIDLMDSLLSKHRLKLASLPKAKLLLYLCAGDGHLPPEKELLRLIGLAR